MALWRGEEKCPKDAKAHLMGKEAKGMERSVGRSLPRPAGYTFSPSCAVARASQGGSWAVAAVEGGCASRWLPAPEVSICAHRDKLGKFRTPWAPLGSSVSMCSRKSQERAVACLKCVFFPMILIYHFSCSMSLLI